MVPLSKVNEVYEKPAITFAPLYRMYPFEMKAIYVLRNSNNNNKKRKCIRCTNIWDKKRLSNFWFESNNRPSFIHLTGYVQCGNVRI